MSIKRSGVSYFEKSFSSGANMAARVNKKGELFMVFPVIGEQYNSPVDNVGGWEADLLKRDWVKVSKTKYYDLRSKLIK